MPPVFTHALLQQYTAYCLMYTLVPAVWYRHSGEPELYEIPLTSIGKLAEESEIVASIGDHQITHMLISNGVLPTLNKIAPHLTHLEIKAIDETSQLCK